jgi:mRNA interferase MazF
MSRVPTPNRGEIWLVDFDPSIGAEIKKVRPAVVVSLNSIGRLPLRLVVPLTDWKPHFVAFPWFVLIPANNSNGLTKDSGADAFQVKSVSLDRLVQAIGNVTAAQIDAVSGAVALCVGAP